MLKVRTSKVPDLLARSEVFGVLSRRAREQLAARASLVELSRGVRLFSRGDDGDAAYLVLSGELEVVVQDADGREVWIAAEGPGGVVGEMAVLDGLPRAADVGASRRSTLLRIPRTAVLDSLKAEPDAAVRLLALLSRRLRGADALLEETALVGLSGRLARLLLRAEGSVTLSQAEMGRIIGASREKVNRKLAEWRAAGWIEISRGGVKVVNRAAMEAAGR